MTVMTHNALDSSMLKSCAYDEDSQQLEIIFISGEKYMYRQVPKYVHEGLIGDKSAGSYFGKNIRGKFESERLGQKAATVKPSPKVSTVPPVVEAPGPLVLVAKSVIPVIDERNLSEALIVIQKDCTNATERLRAAFAGVLGLLSPDRVKPLLELKIQTAEDYTQVAEIGKIIAEFRRNAQKFFKPIKQQTDEPHDVACNIEKQFLDFIVPVEKHLQAQATAYDSQQKRLRQEQIDRDMAEQRRKIEEQRLKDAEAAEAAGKTKLADALLSAPVHVKPIAESALPQAAPKVEGVTKRVNWEFEITDANAIPREWLMVDEKKVGAYVRLNKEKAIGAIPGVRVFSEDSTNF